VTHRVRIIRTGLVQTVVDIDDYDIACDWAYDTLRLQRALDADGRWVATLETGHLFVDMIGNGKSFFFPDGVKKEGLVLDKTMLEGPKIDVQALFGLL
jgi:hypothetical protein